MTNYVFRLGGPTAAEKLWDNYRVHLKTIHFGAHCDACAAKRIENDLEMFDLGFYQRLVERIENQNVSVQPLDMPTSLIAHPNSKESLVVTANLTKLACKISLEQNKEDMVQVVEDAIVDHVIEVRSQLANNALIVDGYVFTPYLLPIWTPTIYDADTFEPYRGLLIRSNMFSFFGDATSRKIETLQVT